MRQAHASTARQAPHVTNLIGRLPQISVDGARAARIAADGRFQTWLATTFGADVGSAPSRCAPPDRLVVDLECAYGALSLAIDAGPWPALRLAAKLTDPYVAREVAALLLRPAVAANADRLPKLAVRALRREAEEAITAGVPLPWLTINGSPVIVLGIDAALGSAFDSFFCHQPALDADACSGLKLPSRLRVFARGFPLSRLCLLGTGDVILSGTSRQANGSWPLTLVFGIGATMQTQANAEIKESHTRLHVDAPVRRIDEALRAGLPLSAAPSALDDMQVPVAFEIDSTLLTLGEIAALGAGAIIHLDAALLNARVRLVSHGQTLGTGQLVAVGDQLGVRIDRMGLDPSPAPGGR